MHPDHSLGDGYARRPIRFDTDERSGDEPDGGDLTSRTRAASEAAALLRRSDDGAVSLDAATTDESPDESPDEDSDDAPGESSVLNQLADSSADNEAAVVDPYAMHVEPPTALAEAAEQERAPASALDDGPRLSPRHQLEQWLDVMVRRSASDLILRSGGRPACRIDGRIEQLEGTVPNAGPMREVLEGVLGPKRFEEYLEFGAADAALQLDGVGRFRINAYRQLGEPAIVLRRISDDPPSLADLCLPTRQLEELALRKRGIMLVTGVAGSGKSTTLAGMIQYLNQSAERHVITLEDPVEMLFKEQRCVISQREVGTDVPNFHQGLRHALRQSPDVILIGEMRDAETVRAAIDATETGHFVMSTLHTVNAAQTIERIVGFFESHQHAQVRARLADTISAVLSQRLIPNAQGEGMVPAVELMQATPYVRELIAEGRIPELATAVEQGNEDGMLSFNGSLLRLIEAGMVEIGAAMAASDKPDELMLALRGFQSRGRGGSQLRMGADG